MSADRRVLVQPGVAWLSAIVLALFGLHAETVAAESGNLLAGDIVTVLTPLTAFGIAYFKDDVEGQKQWLRDTALVLVVNTTLRVAFNQTSLGERPNGDPYGFPSGHASFMFSQAGFLQERYGWRYGVPALIFATGVSYIRVHEDKHYWRDVIAGAVVGYGVALITVTPENAMHIAPVVGPDWLGVRFSRSF